MKRHEAEDSCMAGRPAEPAQCAIYVAAMNYVNEVEAAMDSSEGYMDFFVFFLCSVLCSLYQ